MAFTEPKTWSAGDVLTAADMNTYVRDNVDFLSEPPKCRVYNNANISVANVTYQALTFNTERYDTDTMHSTVSNTDRITCTTAGMYSVGGSISFASNATATRLVALRIAGTTDIATHGGPDSGGAWLTINTIYTMSAADYFTLIAYQSSGGALNVVTIGNYTPEFWATWIGE